MSYHSFVELVASGTKRFARISEVIATCVEVSKLLLYVSQHAV